MNKRATDNEYLESDTPPTVLAYYKRCVELIVFQSNGRDVLPTAVEIPQPSEDIELGEDEIRQTLEIVFRQINFRKLEIRFVALDA
jgi:hypothetical protein